MGEKQLQKILIYIYTSHISNGVFQAIDTSKLGVVLFRIISEFLLCYLSTTGNFKYNIFLESLFSFSPYYLILL